MRPREKAIEKLSEREICVKPREKGIEILREKTIQYRSICKYIYIYIVT